ncbi:MAG: DUF4870 domain-containing protein [Armatimonadota bacterium]
MTDEMTKVPQASETSEPQQTPPPPPVAEPQQAPPPQQQMAPPPTPAATTVNENKIFAILSYLPFPVCLVGIIIVLTSKKDDRFALFHAKQGLVLLICSVIAGISWTLPFINIIAGPVLNIALFILMILGIINAANGEEKPLPVIGQFADKINI